MSLSSYVGYVSKRRRLFDTHVIHVCSQLERAFVSSFLIVICFSLCYATASSAAHRLGSSDHSKLHHTALRNALLDDSSSRLETAPQLVALHSHPDSAVVMGHFGFSAPQNRNLSVDLLATSSWRDRSPPQV
jgi:hypothetical protein